MGKWRRKLEETLGQKKPWVASYARLRKFIRVSTIDSCWKIFSDFLNFINILKKCDHVNKIWAEFDTRPGIWFNQ